MEASAQGPPAENDSSPGWKLDHNVPDREMFWDGVSWTGRTRSANPDAEIEEQDTRLLMWGTVTALLVPIVGFVLGAISCARGRRIGAGVGIMVAAVIASCIWFAVAVEIAENRAESNVEKILDDSSLEGLGTGF